MNFLAPQFLYGLIALAIPLIIHLFNFRKAKRVYFSSNRYLKRIEQQTSSRRNLKHLLILLARIGFISFLVIAFAQPYIPAEERELQGFVQIYLDNSYSMSNETDEDLPALDLGVSLVGSIIDQYPAGTRFRILTNDFEPFSNVFRSGEEVKELLTELNYSRITRTGDQIRERLRTDEIESDRVDTYWISDFQQSIYTGTLADSLSLRLIPLPFTSTRNIFIDSVYTESPFTSGIERLKLMARVVNRGDREVENLNLKVYINNVQVTTNSVTVPSQGQVLAEFDLAFSLEDFNRCTISFEDFPVTFDNDFHFVLNKRKKVDIVEIEGPDASGFLREVYANEDLFDLSSYPQGNIDYNAVKDADLVILNGLENLDNSLVMLLSEYVDELGSMVIIPSEIFESTGFESLLGFSVQLQDSGRNLSMAAPDFSNPFFDDIFEERTSNMKMPSASIRLQWYRDRDAILRLGNGDPFLSKVERGGTMYLFASPFRQEFTDFQLHALYVPVMYKLALLSAPGNSSLYYDLSDEQIAIALDSIPGQDILRLAGSTSEIIPSQRMSGNDLIIDLPPTEMEAGFYRLLWNGELMTWMAFNHDQRESVLTQLEEEDIPLFFANSSAEIFREIGAGEVDKVLYARYKSTPLWKYSLVIALLFLVAEVLLFKFMN